MRLYTALFAAVALALVAEASRTAPRPQPRPQPRPSSSTRVPSRPVPTSSRSGRGASVVPAVTAVGRCTTMTIRKELRDLTPTEKDQFLTVFSQMFQQQDGRPSVADRLSYIHIRNQDTVHGFSNFILWHRYFARRLEMEMQKVNPRVALHYWDWTKEAGYPERGEILSDDWFGANSRGCVNTRYFRNLRALYPEPHCVERDYLEPATSRSRASPGAFYGRLLIDQIREQNTRYDDFRATFEGGPHASPHNGIGGDFGTMGSPNDPLFWVHHSFVDKCYSDWQKMRSSRLTEYSGRNSDMSRALATDELSDLGVRAGQVLDHRRNLCYDFASTGRPSTVLWDRLPPPPTGGTTGPREILLRGDVPPEMIPRSAPPVPLEKRSVADEDDEPSYGGDHDDAEYDQDYRGYDAFEDDADCQKPIPPPAPKREIKPRHIVMHPMSEREIECAADEYDEPIRKPAPIREEFMRMNNICVETQRRLEKLYCDMIDKVNAKIEERCPAEY